MKPGFVQVSAELAQAARAVGADPYALPLQREVAHQPVLVPVHEHVAPRVEAHLVRVRARASIWVGVGVRARIVLEDVVLELELGLTPHLG